MFLKCTGSVLLCSVWSHDIVHVLVHLYPHVLNVLVQYLTCTSPEYWVCLPSSREHGVTLSWYTLVHRFGHNFLHEASKMQTECIPLCCKSQPHTHTHHSPPHMHTHTYVYTYRRDSYHFITPVGRGMMGLWRCFFRLGLQWTCRPRWRNVI